MLEKIKKIREDMREKSEQKEQRKFERLIEENEMLKVQQENMELKKKIMIENKRLKENIKEIKKSQYPEWQTKLAKNLKKGLENVAKNVGKSVKENKNKSTTQKSSLFPEQKKEYYDSKIKINPAFPKQKEKLDIYN